MAVNYTVETITQGFIGGDLIADEFPIVLELVPNEGYIADAANFSVGGITDNLGLGAYIDTIAQGGTSVFFTIDTLSTGTLPFTSPSILVDIDGDASLPEVDLQGDIIISTSNATPASSTVSYSVSGSPGTSTVVDTITLVATSGYELTNLYSVVVALTNSFTANYSVDITETLTGTNVTTVVIVISYIFPAESVTGDQINISANASVIFVPSIVYTSYTGADTLLNYTSEWGAKIYGADTATATLALYDTTNSTAISSTDFVIGSRSASGLIKASIPLPTVTSDTDYTITFSGDIAAGFAQTNPLVVQQRDLSREVTFTAASVAGYVISIVGTPVISGLQGNSGSATTEVELTVESLTLGNLIGLSSLPTVVNEFSNTDSTTNGGTVITQPQTTDLFGEDTTDLTIKYYVAAVFGNSNVTCDIDLSSILTNTTP